MKERHKLYLGLIIIELIWFYVIYLFVSYVFDNLSKWRF